MAEYSKEKDYDGDGKPGTKKDKKEWKRLDGDEDGPEVLTSQELADLAGVPDEWIQENTEIRDLFNRAITEGWHKSALGQAKFTEAFLATNTYQKHGADMAAYLVAKDKGGKDFTDLLTDSEQRVLALATELGANLTDEQIKQFGDRALAFGWDDSELRKVLTGQYSFSDGYGTMHTYDTDLLDYDKGYAQNQITSLKNLAHKNGVGFNDGWYDSAVRSMAAGLSTADDYIAEVRRQAGSTFPQWRERIEAGFDAIDLASPYTEIMKRRLGRTDVDLDDPLLKKAFNGVDDKGAPTMMGTWDFEKMVKRTDEWAESEDGHNEVMSLVREMGRTMGFTG